MQQMSAAPSRSVNASAPADTRIYAVGDIHGSYYKLTPGLPYRGNADFYYVQYQWNF